MNNLGVDVVDVWLNEMFKKVVNKDDTGDL